MPDDAKTLEELLTIVGDVGPHLAEVVDNIIIQYPDLVATDQRPGAVSYDLPKLLHIHLIDFLCAAFGRTDLGYVRAEPRE